jgi:hypothetical protein
MPSATDGKYPARKQEMDNVGRYFPSLTTEHHHIHEGIAHKVHVNSANSAVASLNIAFKTAPGNKIAHMLFGFDINDECLVEIIEGATWTQGSGTLVDVQFINRYLRKKSELILNNKNQATFVSTQQVLKDVTGITGGVVFDPQYTYNASVGANKNSETRSAGHEWTLNSDTTYIYRITKTDANCKITGTLNWYEKTHPTQVQLEQGE